MGRVAIAGGGLAGLTCAKYLLDEGFDVHLVEGQPFLGGRASTYRDADGDWVEQGLHLFLGVYSEFLALLREIGQDPRTILAWTQEVRLRDPEGPSAVFGTNPVTAPLRTLLGVLGNNGYLDPLAKASVVPLVAPGLLPDGLLAWGFDGQTVTDWWRGIGGLEQVHERFIRPFCRAIQFTEPEQFSAYNFLGWIHHIAYDLSGSSLAGYHGARDETIFAPLARHLTARGARVETGRKLVEVLYDEVEARVTGFVLPDGDVLRADDYVVAIPAWAFVPLIPGSLRHVGFFKAIADLPVAPAISVQLWFDRQVTDSSDFTLVARSIAPVYQDQSTTAYPTPDGSRLSVIVSPADELMAESDLQLVARVLKTLGLVEPRMRGANVTKHVVLRHERHLIRPLPGAMSARPGQVTPVENLFLAGDWTQQAFFGSQEGAVRGGKACAEAIARLHEPARGAV